MEIIEQVLNALGYQETLRLLFVGSMLIILYCFTKLFLRVLYDFVSTFVEVMIELLGLIPKLFSFVVIIPFLVFKFNRSPLTAKVAEKVIRESECHADDPDFFVTISYGGFSINAEEEEQITFRSMGYYGLTSVNQLTAFKIALIGQLGEDYLAVRVMSAKNVEFLESYKIYAFKGGKLRKPF